MTAFARKELNDSFGSLVWEIRSLNHRFLEINLHLPEGFRVLENEIRSKSKKFCSRGKLDISLYFKPEIKADSNIKLDDSMLEAISASLSQLGTKLEAHQQINLMDVLSWPGLIKVAEPDQQALNLKALSLFEKTLGNLTKVRSVEGAKLDQIIRQRLDALLPLVTAVKTRMPEAIALQRQKLKKTLSELKEEVTAERLEQELVVLIQKQDVDEELDRLQTHISEVNQALKRSGPVGRRLDFLMQELHREANTLSSKSQDIKITKATLEMKVIIEQMREQVQNIE